MTWARYFHQLNRTGRNGLAQWHWSCENGAWSGHRLRAVIVAAFAALCLAIGGQP